MINSQSKDSGLLASGDHSQSYSTKVNEILLESIMPFILTLKKTSERVVACCGVHVGMYSPLFPFQPST